MLGYLEVPECWFDVALSVSFILACIVCLYYPTRLPIWTLFLAIALCIFLQIPIGIIYAVTNVKLSQNVLAELLRAMHYPKVPPRTMFVAQTYANVLAAFVAVGVNPWQMDNIKDLCQPTQKDNFTCPGANMFFSTAIIWGVIGPKRLFGPRGFYNSLQWAFLVEVMLPIPFWLITRKY